MNASRSRLALAGVKSIHTVAFVVVAGAIALTVVDGAIGQPRRRTLVAAGIALTECGVYAANGFVCPLTPMALRLGAERGSVSDIVLPDRLARHLAWIATPILIAGLALDLAAWRRSRGYPGEAAISRGARPTPVP